ncbi:uncharacterized protein C8R40DRAFT_1069134 [Lentinula edodes]|uniref:uncharacterized protein n=1 Tax=Lentinula edodes TaxID=5353 RepID=UPI001E8DE329|nr:uncharacterized protein C8R40DRAFT_1069134 [Lentinula edodes]KAH7875951.1 hypothetical protein C8R40DRAFT_1069134 [Lentinula edodes]
MSGRYSRTPSLSPLPPIFYAITLDDLDNDSLREITSYLPSLAIASLSAVSRHFAASCLPVLYRSVTVSSFGTLAQSQPFVSRLTGQHPAAYVRTIVVGSSRREVLPSTIRSGLQSVDNRALNPCLLNLEIWSQELTLADVFARSPGRLAPTTLRFECPLIADSPRKSLAVMASTVVMSTTDRYSPLTISIQRSLVSTNLTSLTIYFPYFAPQPRSSTLHKMFMQITPALINVTVFDIWLNSTERDIVPRQKDGNPQPNTLPGAFSSDWFSLPSLRTFLFRDSLYDVPLHPFLTRHPLIDNLTLDIDNFDWLPIPDLASGGHLPRLLAFTGTLPNVSSILRSWSTALTMIMNMNYNCFWDYFLVTLRLLVDDGYLPDVLNCLLSACCHIVSLTVVLHCPLNSTLVHVRNFGVNAAFIRRHAYETLRLLSSVDFFPRIPAGVSLSVANDKGEEEMRQLIPSRPSSLVQWSQNGYMHAFVRALFFGTGMNSPRIVTLPLRPGLREYRTLDDFLVRVYVSRWNITGFNKCSIGRCYIDRFPPDSHSLLSHPFTIFYGEPGTPAPINDLVLKELVMDKYSMASQFRGNLLIVKHVRAHSFDRRYDMIDVSLADYVLLKPIVEWLIDNDFKCTGSTYHYPPVTKLAMPMPHSHSSFNMKIPCVVAYSNLDVARVLFSYVGLKSMLALSRVNKDLSFIIREFYAARVDAVLDLAFDKFAKRSFWFAMEAYHSYIGGSAAYWIMDKESTFAISNINILAPCNTQDPWSTWLVKLGCRELFFHDFTRQNFLPHAKSFRVFQSPRVLRVVNPAQRSGDRPVVMGLRSSDGGTSLIKVHFVVSWTGVAQSGV